MRVSVVITTFNQAPYIAATIESALAQTRGADEIIVVDDGSHDGTADAIAPYRDRVTYIRQANAGVAASRNRGVAASRGDLIALLDGDDLWEPDKLARQIAAAVAHPRVPLIAANGVIFDEDGVRLDSLFDGPVRERLMEHRPLEWDCYDALLKRNLIFTTSQVLIPRWALARVGESDRRYRTCSDWDLYLRLARDHRFVFLPDKLVRWRYLRTSASGAIERRALQWALDEISILKAECARGRPGRGEVLEALVRERVRRSAIDAYAYGDDRDPRWARRYLFAMWRRHRSLRFLLYLVAAYVPPRARRALIGAFRRLAGAHARPWA
jgi:glycosyltransferase involved in cell wall biosynthesis